MDFQHFYHMWKMCKSGKVCAGDQHDKPQINTISFVILIKIIENLLCSVSHKRINVVLNGNHSFQRLESFFRHLFQEFFFLIFFILTVFCFGCNQINRCLCFSVRLQIGSVEFVQAKINRIPAKLKLQMFGYRIPTWIPNAYRQIGIFAFGTAAQQLTTDIAKYSIGRLRPHFFSVSRISVISVASFFHSKKSVVASSSSLQKLLLLMMMILFYLFLLHLKLACFRRIARCYFTC